MGGKIGVLTDLAKSGLNKADEIAETIYGVFNKIIGGADTTSGALPSGNLSDSIQAIRDSAEKLQSKKGALPDNVASFSDAQNNQMISKIKGVLEDMPYTINLPYEIGKKLNSEGRLPLPIGTNMIPPIGKGSPEDVYKISGYKADPNNTNVYGYEITNREGDVSYIGVSDPKMGIKEKKLDMISGWKAALGPEGSKRLNYTPPDWQRTKKPQIVRTPENQKIIDQEYEDLFEEKPDDLTDSIKALQSSAESLKSKKKIKLNPIKKIDNLSESTQDVISSLYFSPDHLRHILDTDKDYARDYLTDLLAGDLTPDRYGYFQESLTKDPVPEELFNNVKKELYNQTQAFLNLNKYSDVVDVYRIGDISKGEIQSFTLNPRFSGESLPWAKDKTLKKYKVNKKDILGSTDIKDPWMEQEILINSDSLRS